MKKIMIILFLVISTLNFLSAAEMKKVKVELKMSNNVKEQLATDKLDEDGKLVLETEIASKIYKTVKPIKLFEGTYWREGFYFERPTIATHLKKEDIVPKEDYDKNSEAYKKQDIFYERLPIGTLFELVDIKLDSAAFNHCHYYIKILNIPKYKDIVIDAACISYMAIDGVWVGKWDWFVNKEKRLIKTKKLPLINKNYAKELTKKEYDEYFDTGEID